METKIHMKKNVLAMILGFLIMGFMIAQRTLRHANDNAPYSPETEELMDEESAVSFSIAYEETVYSPEKEQSMDNISADAFTREYEKK